MKPAIVFNLFGPASGIVRYNNQYAKFKFDNQGYAVIQYTINSTSTKLPFGYKISGAANISLVGTSTHDNGCAIYITSGKPLTTDVSDIEIV